MTTFHGHANVFAPNRFVDFRLATRRGIRALQDDVTAAGGLMSINHPALPSGEACMGCGWTWAETDWSRVAAIEAVNGSRAEGPLAGTGFWTARLNAGDQVAAIAGSDNHDPDAPAGQSPVGHPTTLVHAAELTTAAILQGIRGGDVAIDVEGTRDRLLEVSAARGGRTVSMGGTLAGNGPVRLRLHVVGAAGGDAVVLVDGVQIASRAVTRADETFELTVPAPAARWLAARIERGGHPLLIGNPVYLH